jgi:transcription initiation factor TFIIA large subunit
MNTVMPANSSNPQSARERAASALHQRYGAAAANSVSQLQAQSQPAMGIPGQPRPQNPQAPNGQGPTVKTEPGYPPMSSLGNTQTDGAGGALSEWKAEVARRREAAARGQGEHGDDSRLLRDNLKQRMLQLEGGGLLLPLEEHQYPSRNIGLPDENAVSPGSPGTSSPSMMPRSQYDGPGGDDEKEEDDEDAINSDLDDPEDLAGEDNEGEDAMGQVMLCTYDKVQRVKNKWKCTLKDGILTTGGKE